jgi:putative Ca2+/H+ antiporter (TMEM165/GDT1 family)
LDYKVFLTTFFIIFLAELGDKTQLAAISLTAESRKPLSVFLGASAALMLVTLIGVIFGEALTKFLGEKLIRVLAAVCFITVGIFLLKKAISS